MNRLLLVICLISVDPIFAANPSSPTKVPTVTRITGDTITINTGANNKIKNDTGGAHDILIYKVDSVTTITVNGLKGTLGDVKAGMKIKITIGMDRGVAASIVAYGTPPPPPTAPQTTKKNAKGKPKNIALGQAITEDKITSVGTDSVTVGETGGKQLKAFKIDKDTQIIVKGKKAEIDALQAGMKVQYSVGFDPQTLASITVRD